MSINLKSAKNFASSAVNPMKSSDYKNFLDLDAIYANPTYATQLTIDGVGSIVGVLDTNTDFGIATSANYENTLDMPSFTDQINQLSGLVQNATSSNAQFIMQSIRLTEARWTGCGNPIFDIKLNIPIIRQSQDPWLYLDYILRCTLPLTGSSANQASSETTKSVAAKVLNTEDDSTLNLISSETLLYAPNNYRVNYAKSGQIGDNPEGTVTLKIGEWFNAPHMIITNSQCNISGAKHYDGNPMYLTLQVSLKHWRQPTYNDVRSWFPILRAKHSTPLSNK